VYNIEQPRRPVTSSIQRIVPPWQNHHAAGRFPAPWRADKVPGGYVVRDANGHALAYIYSRDNEAEARQAKVLTQDEARRIDVNIARLPELLGKADRD
jgi:hypothetical protein